MELKDPDTWPFLRHRNKPLREIPDPLGYYEEWCRQLVSKDCDVWEPSFVPGPIGKERVIRAFSGRRRPGDYQWYLERMMQGAPDGLTLYVVSLDIVIDKKYGDLADLNTRNFWLSHIMQGHVHGFLGGSPCCTFSKAFSCTTSGTPLSSSAPSANCCGIVGPCVFGFA